MAFTGITATEAEINQKAGANASASFTDTMKTQALLMYENQLNSAAKFNFSDNYSTLNTDVQNLVTQYTASSVAMDMISYDMGVIGQREAETRLDVLSDKAAIAYKILIDKDKTDWMSGVT